MLETRFLFFFCRWLIFFGFFVFLFFNSEVWKGAKLQSQTDNNCRSFDTTRVVVCRWNINCRWVFKRPHVCATAYLMMEMVISSCRIAKLSMPIMLLRLFVLRKSRGFCSDWSIQCQIVKFSIIIGMISYDSSRLFNCSRLYSRSCLLRKSKQVNFYSMMFVIKFLWSSHRFVEVHDQNFRNFLDRKDLI